MSSLFRCLALLCALLPSFATSLVLSARQNQAGSRHLAKPASLLPALNASAQADRSTTTKDVLLLNIDAVLYGGKVECDDYIFGNPPAASCQDAVNRLHVPPSVISRDPTYSYGPRGRGVWDVNLPKRYISCKSYLISSKVGWRISGLFFW